jgi:hypothetical protein
MKFLHRQGSREKSESSLWNLPARQNTHILARSLGGQWLAPFKGLGVAFEVQDRNGARNALFRAVEDMANWLALLDRGLFSPREIEPEFFSHR